MALELCIAWFLRMGVLSSAVLLAFGWLVSLNQAIDLNMQKNAFEGFAAYAPVSLIDLWNGYAAAGNWGNLIMVLGLLILLVLPVFRVLLTGIMLMREREYTLGICALTVLMGLVAGAWLGAIG